MRAAPYLLALALALAAAAGGAGAERQVVTVAGDAAAVAAQLEGLGYSIALRGPGFLAIERTPESEAAAQYGGAKEAAFAPASGKLVRRTPRPVPRRELPGGWPRRRPPRAGAPRSARRAEPAAARARLALTGARRAATESGRPCARSGAPARARAPRRRRAAPARHPSNPFARHRTPRKPAPQRTRASARWTAFSTPRPTRRTR